MYVGKTLFAPIMEFVRRTSFARIVHRYSGNAGARTLSRAEQFRATAFAFDCDVRRQNGSSGTTETR